VPTVLLLLLGAGRGLCQCPALTGSGNFSAGATVAVFGVPDPFYGTPPFLSVAGAISSWSGALGNPVTTVPWFPTTQPVYQDWVEVQYDHLGAGLLAPNAQTSWAGGIRS
jgi:hypothetical protein